MHLRASILTIKRITLAVVLVDPESTYPAAGTAILQRAELVFPTLPILLIAPPMDGVSPGYATFDFEPLLEVIDFDEFEWQDFSPSTAGEPPPF